MSDASQDMIMLADDYVLGLLNETEAALLEEVMLRDRALAAHVGALRDRLLPLDLSAEEHPLPAGFSDALRLRLQSEPEPLTDQGTIGKPANDSRPPSRWWPGLIAASILGLAVGFGAGWQRSMPEPQVVAVLLDADGVPQAVIEDFGDDTAQIRFVADVDVPADRSLQAWTLPTAELGATSLGVLERVASTRLKFDDLPNPHAEQLYEITLEPLGGSPTGRPTGPIIGKGFAAVQG